MYRKHGSSCGIGILFLNKAPLSRPLQLPWELTPPGDLQQAGD